MSVYGTARWYRNRVAKMHKAGEQGAHAVTCHDCSGKPAPCWPCRLDLDDWERRLIEGWPLDIQRLGVSRTSNLRELVR